MSCVEERPWRPIQSPSKGRKEGESDRVRGEEEKIKFIDLMFERGQVVGFRKGIKQDVALIACYWDQ